MVRKKKFEKDSVEDKHKKTSDWLKTAGYLDTKEQDAINYTFLLPKKQKKTKLLLTLAILLDLR